MKVQVVANYCMELAIQKAKQTGIAWVTCTGRFCDCLLHQQVDNNMYFQLGSNHYGIAGYYALRAVREGLVVSYLVR